MPMAEASAARLEHPGRGDALHPFVELVVVEDAGEVGDEGAGAAWPARAWRACRGSRRWGAAHAGDAHVLAEVGDGLHVEFVEGDEAVERLARARYVTVLVTCSRVRPSGMVWKSSRIFGQSAWRSLSTVSSTTRQPMAAAWRMKACPFS